VREGTIVARFGSQRHPTLKTVTHNTGIEIAVKAGTPVVAVADGEVGVSLVASHRSETLLC